MVRPGRPEGQNLIAVALTFLVAFCTLAPALAYVIWDNHKNSAQLKSQLANFDVMNVDCSNDFDRQCIHDAIITWYGSLEAFSAHVRGPLSQEVLDIMRVGGSLSYRYIILPLCPLIALSLDIVVALLQAGAPAKAVVTFFFSDNKTQRSSSRRGVRGRDREGRRDVVSSSTMDGTRHIGTLDELSNIFARGLLISHSRSSNSSPPGTKSLNLTVDSEIPERSEQNSQSGQSSSQIGERSDSKKTHDAVLEKTRRLSLDLLRSNHDAQAIQDTASRTLSTDSETRGGMPCAAEIWMILAGVLRFGSGWLSRLWGLSLLLMGLATIGSLLLWFSNGHTEPCHGATIATTISYIFGVVCSTWILRSDEVQELVGAQKGNLHMYARNRGFMKEWRRKSKARFCESMGFLIIMCASRFLRYSQGMPLLHDLFPNVAFCFAASGFAAVAYLQLHILSGLELSIDSFSVNFFRTMQFQDAIEEWNVVQATLRHVSLKLSKSLLVLGSCCCGASLVHLIYLPVLRSDARTGLYLILGNQWLLPPIMFFLYTMARAASVTEKASRVSPLVNSWAFESEEPNQWMDLGRQYLVQYMMQSEAGFYMQGVRLRIFQVTKMCYYLGAILFAVGTSIFD
eukprot:Skav227760  [mRNA]  locus=scaffold1653:210986:218160:- [translate_table: standard]